LFAAVFGGDPQPAEIFHRIFHVLANSTLYSAAFMVLTCLHVFQEKFFPAQKTNQKPGSPPQSLR
jgi:hypothetical protein